MMYSLLYVDDEPGLLDIGKLFLEESGEFSVVTVDSASAALDLIGSGYFDAIISDYQMPEMDGIDLLKQVRSKYGEIPFILFTGRGREEVVIEAINCGVDFYVQKGGDIRAQFADLAHQTRRAIERRRVGEALDGNRRYLNQIFSSVLEGILIIDAATDQIIDLNPAAASMIKTTRDQVLHQPRHQWIDSGTTENVPASNLHQGIECAEGVLLTSQGERIPIMRNVVPFTHQGRACLLETIVDNTERKRAEEHLCTAYEQVAAAKRELLQQNELLKISIERLRVSEERFRELSDLLPVPVFETDITGAMTFTNRAIMKVTGHTPEECRQGIHLLDLVGEDEQRAEEVFSAVLAGEMSREGLDCTLQRRDGRTFPAIVYTDRILDPTEGTCRGLRGVILDISKRKEAERGLRESVELHDKLIEAIPDIVVQTALDGTIVSINEIGVIAGGFAGLKDVVGKSMFLFFAPEDLPKVLENTKLMFERKLGPVEYHLIINDGSYLLFEVNGDVLRMPDGRPYGMVFVCRDITERKKSKLALQQANRKLRLLSGVTRHDINNQMMVLMGHLSLVQENRPDAVQDEHFQKITAAAERISAMIQFTREYEEIGVTAPVWQGIGALIRRAAREAPLGDLSVTIDLPETAEVLADPLIAKVFYNLMENAARSGGKISTSRFSVMDRQGDQVIVYEDDGEGILAEEKEKIFWQGFGKNTGLGLFLAREILSITGIGICENGEPGKGARFEITVPQGMHHIEYTADGNPLNGTLIINSSLKDQLPDDVQS